MRETERVVGRRETARKNLYPERAEYTEEWALTTALHAAGSAGCGRLNGVGYGLTCVAARRGQLWSLLLWLSDFAFPCVFVSHVEMMA